MNFREKQTSDLISLNRSCFIHKVGRTPHFGGLIWRLDEILKAFKVSVIAFCIYLAFNKLQTPKRRGDSSLSLLGHDGSQANQMKKKLPDDSRDKIHNQKVSYSVVSPLHILTQFPKQHYYQFKEEETNSSRLSNLFNVT